MWGDECYVTAFLMEINTSYTCNIRGGGGQMRTDTEILAVFLEI